MEDPHELVDLVKQFCGAATWSEEDGASIRASAGGILMVTQSEEVHREVRDLLDRLRAVK